MILVDWYQKAWEPLNRLLSGWEQPYLPKSWQTAKQAFIDNPNEDEAGFAPFLLNRWAKERIRLQQELEQGRDRLLELNSNGGEQAQQLAAAIEQQDGTTGFN